MALSRMQGRARRAGCRRESVGLEQVARQSHSVAFRACPPARALAKRGSTTMPHVHSRRKDSIPDGLQPRPGRSDSGRAAVGVRFSVENSIGIFFCPGCKCNHRVPVNGRTTNPSWVWNKSQTKLTLSPSLNYNFMDPTARCHSIVSEGRIQFLADCFHSLAGCTVELPIWGQHNE